MWLSKQVAWMHRVTLDVLFRWMTNLCALKFQYLTGIPIAQLSHCSSGRAFSKLLHGSFSHRQAYNFSCHDHAIATTILGRI